MSSKKKSKTLEKQCPSDKIINPLTKRCVLKTGKLGQKILADMHKTKEKSDSKPKPKTEKKVHHTDDEKKHFARDPVVKEIKIVSYNIHNGFYDAAEKVNTFYSMCDWLQSVNPDVVLFQEVTFRKITRKAFETKMHQLGYKHIAYGFAADLYGSHGGHFFGQATCSKIPFVNQLSAELSPDPIKNEGRNALFVTLDLSVSSKKKTQSKSLTVVNTHLDVWDRSGKTRLKQVKEIDHVLNERNLFPAMVCGDFNTVRRHDYTPHEWKELHKYEIETKTLDYIASMGVQDALDLVGKKTSRSIVGLDRRIDFMFAFDPYSQIKITDATIDHKAIFSDHHPVICVIHV